MSGSRYEAHVTVRCPEPGEAERLGRWAAAAGLRLTHIVLARGRMRHQPRTWWRRPGTWRWGHFVTEYPRCGNRDGEFAERLVRAVTPAFARDGG
ncbi:hypothetical protein [Streptomyces pactum]|uniref:hypothetical protein n=1 Tax=Streptomyces pactum TaxID=68249 RepID=UPI001F4078D0|nr:hypothetical protein [Streptomyces pactum]